MAIDPLLVELWIVALCALVNRTPARVHADVLAAVRLRALMRDCAEPWS